MTDKTLRLAAGLPRRHRAERRFRFYGIAAVAIALIFLALVFAAIVDRGAGAFRQTMIELDVTFERAVADPDGTGDVSSLRKGDYEGLAKTTLRRVFPEIRSRRDKRALYGILSSGAGDALRDVVRADPSALGTTRRVALPASDDIDMLVKGAIDMTLPGNARRVSDNEANWLDALDWDGRVHLRFNRTFFTSGDSREPELAGVLGALAGSMFSLLVCLALSFPVGILSAVYLEAFAPRGRWTQLIEVNINNLAAVPSIVFGLLGLAVFLNVFEMPRSSPLVGGMVLALMTLPTIIIASRASLKSVPPSIREAALAIGASPVQAVFHHVVPLAMPGMMTGAIIGMARALGETAPLLMIGMVAFIADVPEGVLDPATALPVQIFLWADSPERAFAERTAATILVLLGFLLCMNLTAVLLRRKFEIRW